MQIVIKSISGRGFLTFKNTFIQDFEKFGNAPVLIVGENKVDVKSLSNGSGKSSLIEALNFVFFGTTGRNLKYADEVINWDSESCTVESKILVGKEEYEIWRNRIIGKATTLTIYHSLGKGSSEEILPQADNKTKQAWLEHLLGFSFTSWSCAVMFHQDFVAFPDLKPPQRAEILSEVADLDIYLEAAKLSNKKLNLINNRVSLLEHDVITRLQSLERLQIVDYDVKIEEFESDRQMRIIGLRKQQRTEKSKDEDEKKRALGELEINITKRIECTLKIKELEHKKDLPIENPEIAKLGSEILALEHFKAQGFSSPEIDSRIIELEKWVEILPETQDQLLKLTKSSTEIDGEIGFANQNIEKINKEMEKFKTLGVGNCPTCKQEVSSEHLQDHLTTLKFMIMSLETKKQNWVTRKEASIKLLKESQDKYSLMKQDEKELELKRKERQKLELNFFEGINQEIVQLNDKKHKIEADHLNHLNDLITNFKGQLHILQLESQALQIKIASDAGEKLVAALESQIESVRQLENNYIGLKKQNDQQIKEVEQEIHTMQEEVDDKKDRGNYLSYWIDGYKRLRMMMFDFLIIRLEELSQDFLSDYSSELSVNITGEKDLKSGGKKDEVYIEVVNTKGKKSSFEAYSGGERQKVKMSVSLALSEVIKEKCGKDFNLICFDEANDSLDDIGKDTNFQAFKKIAGNKTVLVVDHEGYFQDRFDQVITIVKEVDGSYIRGN